MGGPSAHGQRNKGHKAGRHAGKSARDKHRAKKEASGPRASIKARATVGKAERAHASKQHRDAKRAELLEARRRGDAAPVLVALLPLSHQAPTAAVWASLVAASSTPPAATAAAAAGGGMAPDADMMDAATARQPACCLTHLGLPGRPHVRLTLLPPPVDRSNPLAVVEVARTAEVLLLLVPGDEGGVPVDAEGVVALQVLRAMGMPTTLALVTSSSSSSQAPEQQAAGGEDAMAVDGEPCSPTAAAANSKPRAPVVNLKARSAAKKRAEKVLAGHLAIDALRFMAADTPADMAALLRALGDKPPQLPVWRRQRPSLLVEAAGYTPDASSSPAAGDSSGQGASGVLALTGWVREAGLSANQLVTVPGAGDFQVLRIEAAEPPAAAGGGGHKQRQKAGAAPGSTAEIDMVDAHMAAAAAAAGGGGGACSSSGRVLAVPDPEQQEAPVRENAMDPMMGEQTWPTDEELAEAEAAAAAAAAGGTKQRRRLPAGTSDYQAAWILDEDEAGSSEDGEGSEDDMLPAAVPLPGTTQALEPGDAGDLDDLDLGDDDPGTDGMMLDDEEEEEAGPGSLAARRAALKAQRSAAADDAQFPDEVDTPEGVAARVRFARYRGLKSFRSSPWDVREGLPAEYGRVWAFENLKRTAKRAREAQAEASAGLDPCAVSPGTYVTLYLSGVPAAAAAAICQRTAAATQSAAAAAAGGSSEGGVAPLRVSGLLQHEAKLSVVNFSVKTAVTYGAPLANKEELLLVFGTRSFKAQPVWSADEHGADKYKMLRWVQPGQQVVGSIYAPIMYAPQPVLAFKVSPGATPCLAAAGALRGADPDRVVIKKAVLSGYPVRVHKTRAVVRFMFWNAEDIRWFQPLELWTKGGRRGRITEPLGTHGAYKARFDGPVQQRDGVCLSLYKRAFPKWPAQQLVAAGGGGAQQQQSGATGGSSSSNETLDNCTFA